MFKKPIFWIIYVLLFIACVTFSIKNFSRAFPIVNLDLKMNRQTAIQKAVDLAGKYNWGPKGYKQASSFGVNAQVRNYVELEAGGSEAFSEMLKSRLYSPYTWRVRHFREGETNEVLIRFTPSGEPYGFVERLPEGEPGPDLPVDSGKVIAETTAKEEWAIDLSAYDLVEKSREVLPGGRVDHTFVYERPDLKIGEGRYRLRLVVGGDKLTELSHFMKIPEAFSRRYQEMRSTNSTIANTALMAVALLYILGGCVIGMFFLLRQRWVIWRMPLLCGFFVSFMQVLERINNWPLIWMYYDTSLSSLSFLLQQIVQMVIIFMGMGIVLSLSFMAAESLTRKAFPRHIRFWNLWYDRVSGTQAVLGRTIGGYLFVGFEWAFIVALYLFTSDVLGWWSPSGTLFHPDALATYFPWLTSIAISLQAGFWEECLFRAIPIAGAALIGQKFGARRAWIIGAFIVQALIFGAGHANYAQQPSYARMVELFIPSIAWGLIYLRFGLLPVIVLHFAFDVVAFAIPIFVSTTPGIWFDRTMIIVLTLIPLFIVMKARIRNKEWLDLKEEHYNRSWQPLPEKEEVEIAVMPEKKSKLGLRTNWLIITGMVCFLLWFFINQFQNYAPPLIPGRDDVEITSRKALDERNINLSDDWKLLSGVETPLNQDDRFVWQKGGKEKYRALIGKFITPPLWGVRFARFKGDIGERAEEYRLFISKKGEIRRFLHILPEARPGASIAEDKAREIAHTLLEKKYHYDPSLLKEISIVPSQLPKRKDWTITFADTMNYPLDEGEARVAVRIAGDKVVDSYRFIRVPEEWARSERDQRSVIRAITALNRIIIMLMFLTGAVWAIINWSQKRFSTASFLTFFAVFFGTGILSMINAWPSVLVKFSTAAPYKNQIYMAIGMPLLALLIFSAGPALIIGITHKLNGTESLTRRSRLILPGFALGCTISCIMSIIERFVPSMQPFWANYAAVGHYMPFLGTALAPIGNYITTTALFLLIFTSVNFFTNNWDKRKALFSCIFIVLGFILSGTAITSPATWPITGPAAGIALLLAYIFLVRFHLSFIPLAFGFITILYMLKQCILNAYPAAIPGSIFAIVLIAGLSIYWHEKLSD